MGDDPEEITCNPVGTAGLIGRTIGACEPSTRTAFPFRSRRHLVPAPGATAISTWMDSLPPPSSTFARSCGGSRLVSMPASRPSATASSSA